MIFPHSSYTFFLHADAVLCMLHGGENFKNCQFPLHKWNFYCKHFSKIIKNDFLTESWSHENSGVLAWYFTKKLLAVFRINFN
jgi:hypothetical protein